MSILSQSFPPRASLTEENLPDQTGKVVIVTGGGAGVGAELVKILYGANATVYIAARTQSKAERTIAECKKTHPASKGRVEFLNLDLADLPTIKTCALEFLSRESRLDILVNNAGIISSKASRKSAQGYEAQFGTNCLGPFVLSELLRPVMERTVHSESVEKDSVRVCWLGSLAIDLQTPKGGIDLQNITSGTFKGMGPALYAQSKAGNMFLASEYARRHPDSGILSLACNPGNLLSELPREFPSLVRWATRPILYQPRYGAYTELYTSFSKDIAATNNGQYVVPWGRLHTPRKDLVEAMKPKNEGGSGIASDFWDWCDQEMKKHVETIGSKL